MTFSFSNCVCLFPQIFLSGPCHFSLLAHTVGVHDAAEQTVCKWFICAREEHLLNSVVAVPFYLQC
jgi:hypothetical protein